jgi:hypothetical protein
MTAVRDGEDYPIWDEFVIAVLALAAVHERRSRYGDKPALWLDDREIAHLEAPGVIDLRITHSGWSEVKGDFGDDPAVLRDRSRRDWIELRPRSAAELIRLNPVLAMAVASNRR